MIALLALPLALLSQQQGIAQRLAGRVPPAVASAVEELGTAARARGLPTDPLIQKAIEGSAKEVPAERVIAALRAVMSQLDTAAVALRRSGISDTVAIEAGAFALNAGMQSRHFDTLHLRGAVPEAVAPRLRVAGTLVALGVPADDAVSVVNATVESGRPAGDLLALPGRVRAEVAKGVPPAQAAAGLARAAAAQSRRGPPPARPQPPPHPAPAPRP